MLDYVCCISMLCNPLVKAKKTGIFQTCSIRKGDGDGE